MTAENEIAARLDGFDIPDGAIVVIARVTAKGGREDELAAVTAELQRHVRADEPGNLVFRAHQSDDVPGVILFYEIFRNRAGLEAHKAAPHLKDWFRAISELVADNVDVLVCKPLRDE